MADSTRTLLLTPFMALHGVISWQRAVVLVWLDKVDVLEAYDERLASPSWSLLAPAVVRLRRPVRVGAPRAVRFTLRNVYARDGFACQYCGERLPARALTYDHVVPRVRGGATTWDNVVTACRACNDRKGGRAPEQAGMRLLRRPARPRALPPATPAELALGDVPAAWRAYCEAR